MEKIELSVKCPFCGKISIVSVYASDYEKYKNGAYVQNAFPYLSIEDRETLISGMCEECQTNFFG